METEISKHQRFSINLSQAKACFELVLDFFGFRIFATIWQRRGWRYWKRWVRLQWAWLILLPIPVYKWISGANSKNLSNGDNEQVFLKKKEPEINHFFLSIWHMPKLVCAYFRLVWLQNFSYHLTKKRVKILMMTNSSSA